MLTVSTYGGALTRVFRQPAKRLTTIIGPWLVTDRSTPRKRAISGLTSPHSGSGVARDAAVERHDRRVDQFGHPELRNLAVDERPS
jgi:hypothetical protein